MRLDALHGAAVLFWVRSMNELLASSFSTIEVRE
jgi:hypothetical protein